MHTVLIVLCFVVVMQSFIMNSHEVFIHIHQDCFAGTGAIVRLPQCQWSKPDGYGKIGQCITTTKHSKAKTVCIFHGIYCTLITGQVTSWCSEKLHTIDVTACAFQSEMALLTSRGINNVSCEKNFKDDVAGFFGFLSSFPGKLKLYDKSSNPRICGFHRIHIVVHHFSNQARFFYICFCIFLDF